MLDRNQASLHWIAIHYISFLKKNVWTCGCVVFTVFVPETGPHSEQRPEGDTQLLSVALCLLFLREMPNTERLFMVSCWLRFFTQKAAAAQVL